MPAFQYEAIDTTGRTRKGVLSADSQRLARLELKDKGLIPVSMETVGAEAVAKATRQRPIRSGELVLLTRQLATLVSTATPVEEALNAVATEMGNPALRGILLSVRARVMEGWKLSDAMAEHPKSFPALYRGVVAAGETSGEFGQVLSRLADMLEKNRAIQMKALTALIYPIILFIVAILVVSGLMVFVIPQIVEQFDSFGADLPWITNVVIAISNFLQDWGLVLLALLVGSCVGIWRARKIHNVRLSMDRALLRTPFIGNLARSLDAARFARTLATLVASGTPLLDSLGAARRTVVNADIGERIGAAQNAVREGANLSGALRKSAPFAPMMAYMVAAGERAGDLPTMLDKTAATMEEAFDTVTTVALRLLEPLIIVLMGLIVLAIVLAILIPILQINTLAGF